MQSYEEKMFDVSPVYFAIELFIENMCSRLENSTASDDHSNSLSSYSQEYV